MRAALPFVDRFLPGHNLGSLEELADVACRHREEARGMKDILEDIERWRAEGEKVVVATVVATRRSAPRPVGTSLAVSESGEDVRLRLGRLCRVATCTRMRRR